MDEKRFNFAASGIFLLIGLAAYFNIAHAFFLSDDFDQIGKVLNGDLAVTWGREHGGFFRPLFILSYLIDAKLWGAASFGFHLTNIAFHIINAFLVLILARRLIELFDDSSRLTRNVSLAAGLLFLLHPSHTECVSWISGRADLIATFFSLASLISYISYLRAKRLPRVAFSLLCFALALLAKEAAICLPFVMLVIGGVFALKEKRAETFKQTIKIASVFALLLLIFILVRDKAIGSLVGGYGTSQHLNFAPSWIRDRLLQFSLRAVLPPLPLQLSAVLLRPLKSLPFILFAVACAMLFAAMIIYRHKHQSAAARRPQNILIALLLLSFLCCLLPVINLRLSLYDSQGERFLYLPSVFSCIALAYISAVLVRRTKFWFLLIGCSLIFYAVALHRANENWRQAAVLSQTIINDVTATSEHDNLLILNAPDNLNGAPVYHNGLIDALRNFQTAKQFKDIRLIALHSIQSANDSIELTGDSRSFAVRLRNEACEFERVEALPGCADINNRAKNSFQFQLGDCARDTDIFVFDKGRMRKILPPQ